MNLTTIDPCADGIRPHHCINHIAPWPDNSPRMEALRRELMTTGLCAPVAMTARHEITDPDSRERWRAARMLQLPSIPVCIIPPEQVATACLSALIHRRHQTKSALAYLAFPLLETALDEARHRQHQMLKKGNVSPSSAQATTGKTVEEIADSYGIARTVLFDAKKVHAIFAKDPIFRAQMEPRLLAEPIGGEHEQNRPVGLGAIIAGYEGKKNEDRARVDAAQLDLFGRAVKAFCIRAPQITDSAAAREIVRAQLDQITDPEELDRIVTTAALVVSEGRQALKQARE